MRVLNLRKGLNESERMGIGEQIEWRRISRASGRLAARKERRYRLAENGADLEEASAADAIAALLVFLDLLKRESEFYGQVCLR